MPNSIKLRNKKTGQLGNFIINKDHFECIDLDYVPEYRKLAELNAEWEDYEKPKECWWSIMVNFNYRENRSEVSIVRLDKKLYDPSEAKEIGFYFETKEEAEKAVEKLKAWKRLKDRNFRFNLNYSTSGADINHKDVIMCQIEAYFDDKWEEENMKAEEDLDLLLGGEE